MIFLLYKLTLYLGITINTQSIYLVFFNHDVSFTAAFFFWFTTTFPILCHFFHCARFLCNYCLGCTVLHSPLLSPLFFATGLVSQIFFSCLLSVILYLVSESYQACYPLTYFPIYCLFFMSLLFLILFIHRTPITPVSYTHLDVYKRQNQKSLRKGIYE